MSAPHNITLGSSAISRHVTPGDLERLSELVPLLGLSHAEFTPLGFIGGPRSGQHRHRMTVQGGRALLTIGRFQGLLKAPGYSGVQIMEIYDKATDVSQHPVKPKLGEVGITRSTERMKEFFTALWARRDLQLDTFTKAVYLEVLQEIYETDNKVSGIIFGHFKINGMIVEMGEVEGVMHYTLGDPALVLIQPPPEESAEPQEPAKPAPAASAPEAPLTPLDEAMAMIKDYPELLRRRGEIIFEQEALASELSRINEQLTVLEPAVKALEALTGKKIL